MTAPQPLTAARIEEIRGRLEKATPGPWTYEMSEANKIKDARGDSILSMYHTHLRGRRPNEEVEATARMIAAAPADIAALLAEVERLRKLLSEWLALECRRPKAASNTVFVDTRGWEFLKAETRAALGEDSSHGG